jgi:hypothetical protein
LHGTGQAYGCVADVSVGGNNISHCKPHLWGGFFGRVVSAACQRGLESAFAGRQPDDRLSSQDSSYGVLHQPRGSFWKASPISL